MRPGARPPTHATHAEDRLVDLLTGGRAPSQPGFGWDLLRRVVEVPSPTGSEAAVVELLLREGRNLGFRVSSDAAGNFIAEAGLGERLLLFVGHVDTVPGQIPVRVEGDELWGRGSVDAKGPLVAMLEAARAYLDDPRIRIRVVGAVDEEGHSAGAKALDRSTVPEWIIVGEPSGSDAVTLGYKGILRARCVLGRTTVHGGHPDGNALDAFHEFWCRVRALDGFGDGFDAISARLDSITSRHDGLTDEAHVRFQIRLPPGASPANVTGRLQALGAIHGAQISVDEAMPAAVASPRTDLVAAFRSAIREDGHTPRLKHKTGTADFNHLAGWFPGVPMLAYGPGDSHLDHTPAERVARNEYERAVRVLGRVFERLATSKTG